MIDKKLLQKFVVGLGTDEEVGLCESYLRDCDVTGSETLIQLQLDRETQDDSLIQSLQNSREDLDSCEDVTDEVNACIQARLETTDVVKFLHPPEANDEIGRIGKYRLLERIGSGGMGIVFRAEHLTSGSAVALKVMNPMMASNPLAAERFQREVRSAAKLDHDRIVRIHDIGTDTGIPFFAMELLQGQTLGQRLEKPGRLPILEVKRIVTQIAEGLDYASQHGILHRDIKPDNLWLTEDGDVIILDFGLARGKDDTAGLTNTGDVLGTPRYMAPEQVKGQATDQRTDLFSLGSVMFEMLSGTSKFADANVYSTMMAVTQRETSTQELTDLGCPEPLAKLTCELLAKAPECRPESAAMVLQKLGELELKPSSPPGKIKKSKITIWSTIASVFIVASLLAALGIFVYIKTDRGTLVVEAGEGVEITTEDEGVKIRLVDSEKSYRITVGAQQIPSGEYEIVVDDLNDDLSFSSKRFVIRRGKEEIVKVSLLKSDSEPLESGPNKYAPVADWFTADPSLFNEGIFALGTVARSDGRDFEFRLDASIKKTNEEFRTKDSRFYFSIENLFGSTIQVLRDGRAIGHAKLLDNLPLKKGETQDRTVYIGRLDRPTDDDSVQADDILVVYRDRESMATETIASIDPIADLSGYSPRPSNIRKFLSKEFPGVNRVFVGSVANVSPSLVRFELDRCFDLTKQRWMSGEEYISNGSFEVPSLDRWLAHVYSGSKRIGKGRVTSLLGSERNSMIEIDADGSKKPKLNTGQLVVIPVVENANPIHFDSSSNLAALPALSIMETLGLKTGDPLTSVALISDPPQSPNDNARDGFASWTIEAKYHRARINDIAINSSKQMVAIGADDAMVRIWKLNRQPENPNPDEQIEDQLIHVLPCRWPVKRVCWSAKENVVAVATHDPVGDAGFVLVWRIDDGQVELIHRINKRADELAFCPLGVRLAIQTADTLDIVDVSLPAPETVLSIDSSQLTRKAWSDDGKMIACSSFGTGNSNRKVTVIDLEKAAIDGNIKGNSKEFPNSLNAGFISPGNGKTILSMVRKDFVKSTIESYDGSSFEHLASTPLNFNSKIFFRENQPTFFRVDSHSGLWRVPTQDIFYARFGPQKEQDKFLRFEKMATPRRTIGYQVNQPSQFVVDDEMNLIGTDQFMVEAGGAGANDGEQTEWYTNLTPAEYDSNNGLIFRLNASKRELSKDVSRISARNLLNGKIVAGPKITATTQQNMLIQRGAISASPDGKRIAFLGKDLVRIYDVQSESTSDYPFEITGNIPRIVWSPNSKFVIVQDVSKPSLTIINPNSGKIQTRINAEASADGMGFSDTSDRVVLDRQNSERVFWRHRSDGIGFFDIDSGRKLVEYVVQPRPERLSPKKPWIASYDWHQETGQICLLVRSSMLKDDAWLEIHNFDGVSLVLVTKIDLDDQVPVDWTPTFATFDDTASHVLVCSKQRDNARHYDQGSRYEAFKIDVKTEHSVNIGTIRNSQEGFQTNRKIVVAITAGKVSVLSIDDSKIQHVPFATDSLQRSRIISKFGDRWLLICGRQIALYDESFRLISTALTTHTDYRDGVSVTSKGLVEFFDKNGPASIELMKVGIRDNQVIFVPAAKE